MQQPFLDVAMKPFSIVKVASAALSTLALAALAMPAAAQTRSAPNLTLSSTPNPSNAGQTVTFTVTASGSGAAPTGNVTFYEGENSLANVALVAGQAAYTTSTLSAGVHLVGAVYGGDTNYTGGVATVAHPQVVNGSVNQSPTVFLPLVTFPTGTVGVTYPTFTYSASGGTAPYTYSVSQGALPGGFSLSSSGTLAGKPTATGTFNFTISASDANAVTGSHAYSIAIGQSQTITFTNPGAQIVSNVVNLTASASSGLPVTLSSFTPAVCSVSGTQATLLTIGHCSIIADQAGNASYSVAPRVSVSFAVNAVPSAPDPPINLACTGGVGQAICTFSPPANNGGSVISVYNIHCSLVGGSLTSVGAGNTSPITVGGLTSGTTWNCTAIAHNTTGDSASSAASANFTTVTTLSVPPPPNVNRAFAGNTNAIVGFTPFPGDGGASITRYTAFSTPGGINAGCNVPCNAIVVNGLTNGTSYTFTVAATNSVGTGQQSTPSNAVTPLATNPAGPPTPPIAQRGSSVDIDGSGKGQILLRNGSGQYQVGRLANNQLQFSNSSVFSTNYKVIAFGDFNGDGKSDIALQNTTQGEFGDVVIAYSMDFSSTLTVRQVKLAWLVQAIADLDGDGHTDMAFRFTGDDGTPNDTGVSYIWFMNGSTVDQVRKRGGAPLSWTLLGALDINGDLAADMVYIDPNNNIKALMATPQRTCANLSAGSLPTGATALKLAEFTGAGTAAILSHDSAGNTQLLVFDGSGLVLPASTGNPDDPNASCTASNLQVSTSTIALPTVDPTWQLYATGDLNGDGYTDIVWLLPNGSLTVWLMGANSAAPTILSNAGTPPSGYTVLQP